MSEVVLRHGGQEARVDVRGGGLRDYRIGGRRVLDGCPQGGPCTAARGDLLLPWPNRIACARYRFDGVEHRLPVTEPATGAAIHGLTRDLRWTVAERRPDRVRLRLDLTPRPGYPFALACEVEYALGTDGLRVRTGAANTGAGPAPFATGAHPYLTVGNALIDEAELQVPAVWYYPTDVRGTPDAPGPSRGRRSTCGRRPCSVTAASTTPTPACAAPPTGARGCGCAGRTTPRSRCGSGRATTTCRSSPATPFPSPSAAGAGSPSSR